MKKFLYIIAITLSFLFLTSCGSSGQRDTSYLNTGDYDAPYDEETDEYTDNTGTEAAPPVSYGEKAVPAGKSLKDAGRAIYTELSDLESRYGLGGVKLCAEMSADRDGKPYSSFSVPTKINFRPYEELHLKKIAVEENPFCIVSEIINGDISVNVGIVSFAYSHFVVPVYITNHRDYSVGVHILRGQMLEVQVPNVQNVVIIQPLKIMVEPNQTKNIQVKAFCAAEKRQSPSGHYAKLTPFVLDAHANIFGSQDDIWVFIRSIPKTEERKLGAYTKKIRLSNGRSLYVEEKDNGIGPYSSEAWINAPWTRFRRWALNNIDFPNGFQKCAAQHDVDYGTLGFPKEDADKRLKECAEDVFHGTVGDFCRRQSISEQQFACFVYGARSAVRGDSFASFVYALMAGGETSYKEGQKMTRATDEFMTILTSELREEIEQRLGMPIDANRYYYVLE